MIILIKILLAHLLGDFLFQPDSWIKAKEKEKLFAWQLYVHTFIHFILIPYLTRGMKGCFVYFTDKQTKEYFRKRMKTWQ